MHVAHQGQGHKTRTDCATSPARPWLPHKRQAPARYPRHCTAQIQDRHIYQRLFLARPRRMQVLRVAKEQHRVLGKENRTQQTTRHLKTHPTAPLRLAHNYHLGMTPLSVSFLAIVTRSGGKSATVWDAIKKRANANSYQRTDTPPCRLWGRP